MAESANPTSQDFRLTPGTILGNKYQIIKKIGEGGMGTVYMAYDTQPDIRVAIKVVSPRLTGTMDETQLDHDVSVPHPGRIEEVHAAGIIHRDIKPEFFFLKGNVPRLGDFGLSLDFDLPPVTQSVSDILGTVAYMAPESRTFFDKIRFHGVF